MIDNSDENANNSGRHANNSGRHVEGGIPPLLFLLRMT